MHRLPLILDRCTGCGRCVAACPPHVLWLEARGWDKTAVLHDAPGCTGCAICAQVCPFSAIRMRPAPGRGPGAADDAGPSPPSPTAAVDQPPSRQARR